MMNKTRMPTLIIPVQHYTGVLASTVKQEKEKLSMCGKEELKLSVFGDSTVIYIENLME